MKEYGLMALNLESERLVIADKDGVCFRESVPLGWLYISNTDTTDYDILYIYAE